MEPTTALAWLTNLGSTDRGGRVPVASTAVTAGPSLGTGKGPGAPTPEVTHPALAQTRREKELTFFFLLLTQATTEDGPVYFPESFKSLEMASVRTRVKSGSSRIQEMGRWRQKMTKNWLFSPLLPSPTAMPFTCWHENRCARKRPMENGTQARGQALRSRANEPGPRRAPEATKAGLENGAKAAACADDN